MNKYSKSNYNKRKAKYPRYARLKKQSIARPKTPTLLRNKTFRNTALIIILIGALVYLFLFSPAFKIVKTEIIAPNGIELRPLQDILKMEFEKRHLAVLDGSSLFLFNKSNVEDKIMQDIPKIREVRITKKFPKTLILEVQKREPVLLWCFQGEADCFLVDKDGIIFEKTTLRAPLEGLSLLQDEQQVKNILEEACTPQEMAKILEISSFLTEKLDIVVNNFIKDNKGRLDVVTTDGWAMYFDLNSDVRLALTKLKLLLDNEINFEERKNLRYIELRYSRVYYTND